MEKVRKFDRIWNAERVLGNILCYANEKGFISYEDNKQDIRRQSADETHPIFIGVRNTQN